MGLELLAIPRTVIATTSFAIQICKEIRGALIRKRIKKEYIEDLFGFIADSDISTGRVSLDDETSLAVFRKWFYTHFKRNRPIEECVELPVIDMNKHLCSIGGPVDHRLTRYVMGYEKSGKFIKPVLPYHFPIREVEAKNITVIRKYKEAEWKVKNWYIADRDGNPKFVPGTDRNRVLNKDYVMLIVVPNTLTEQSIYLGQKHLVIACTHGLAQLAVGDLLESEAVLKELMKVRRQTEYFQAIIEIGSQLSEDGYVPQIKNRKTAPPMVIEPLEMSDIIKKSRLVKDWL